VDLQATNAKLRDRGERILMAVCGLEREKARQLLEKAGGRVKSAIVMQKMQVGCADAERLLEEAGGVVRRVVGGPPP
jgi:N-acetylmuramic acid 6-phosphate etherase